MYLFLPTVTMFLAGFFLWKLCFINPVVVWLFGVCGCGNGAGKWSGMGKKMRAFGASFSSVGSCCRAAGFSTASVLITSPARPATAMWKQNSRWLHRERGKIISASLIPRGNSGNLSPVQEVVVMPPALWLCLSVVTAVTPMSHQLPGEFL